MNSITLMGEMVTEPEIRYTPDNLAVASMLVKFPSERQGEPDYQVRVAVFGDVAQQVTDSCQPGDRVLVEGQLHVNTVERDGRNEKRAEINARRVYTLGAGDIAVAAAKPSGSGAPKRSQPAAPAPVTPAPTPEIDEIPF